MKKLIAMLLVLTMVLALGQEAASRLIELIEHPKTTLIDRHVVSGSLQEGGSVSDLR